MKYVGILLSWFFIPIFFKSTAWATFVFYEPIFSLTFQRKGLLYYSPRRRRWCHTLVKVFVPILLFVKTITDIALKLITLIHHHYLHQQTRVHNSVKVFVRIMALFLLRILVKFFVPIYFFSKPLQIWIRNLHHLFTIITSINRQENITLSRFLDELLPFFDLVFWLSFLYQFTFFQNHYRYCIKTYITYSPSLLLSTDKSI